MNTEDNDWLDDRGNVAKIIYALGGVCLALLAVDLLYHKHAHFTFEHWTGFYGLFGFAAGLVLVLAARGLRTVVRREEDYYDQ